MPWTYLGGADAKAAIAVHRTVSLSSDPGVRDVHATCFNLLLMKRNSWVLPPKP